MKDVRHEHPAHVVCPCHVHETRQTRGLHTWMDRGRSEDSKTVKTSTVAQKLRMLESKNGQNAEGANSEHYLHFLGKSDLQMSWLRPCFSAVNMIYFYILTSVTSSTKLKDLESVCKKGVALILRAWQQCQEKDVRQAT